MAASSIQRAVESKLLRAVKCGAQCVAAATTEAGSATQPIVRVSPRERRHGSRGSRKLEPFLARVITQRSGDCSTSGNWGIHKLQFGIELDFKYGGCEFKSWWGQTKIYRKKILPWGVLMYSYFELLRVIL